MLRIYRLFSELISFYLKQLANLPPYLSPQTYDKSGGQSFLPYLEVLCAGGLRLSFALSLKGGAGLELLG